MKRLAEFRRTKIVCTIGPSTDSAEKIRDLILAGMDVARLNFAHGDHESHRNTLRVIRRVSKDLGREVAVLQDLGGPKIRVGDLAVKERLLEPDERVALTPGDGRDPSVIPINYPYLLEDVHVGDPILLGDGLVELRVEEKDGGSLLCRVVLGGKVLSHKGVNLPSSSLRVPAFTEKDRKDLKVGLENGVDFVGLSFVRHEKDLEPVREMMKESESPPRLIAKIEKPQAIDRLDCILAQVDGVMVARGDLGVEMPLEQVPIIQKRIIRLARRAAKPVITATQMLRTMIDSPRPSRAEATDVANAVLDGTDALMLSDETAMGEYPVEAVKILDRIARATESHLREFSHLGDALSDDSPMTASSVGRAANAIARDLEAAAIVAGTSSGSTARLIARFRPSCPVLGLTPNRETERQLALSWGVIPALVAPFLDTDEIFDLAKQWVLDHELVEPGDRVVVTAGVPVGVPGTTNLLKVIEIE
jgi:pyruvate kinase